MIEEFESYESEINDHWYIFWYDVMLIDYEFFVVIIFLLNEILNSL
jgi:hypothetical protein